MNIDKDMIKVMIVILLAFQFSLSLLLVGDEYIMIKKVWFILTILAEIYMTIRIFVDIFNDINNKEEGSFNSDKNND